MSETGEDSASGQGGSRGLLGLSFAPREPVVATETAATSRLVDIDQAIRVVLRHRWMVLGVIGAALLVALLYTLVATREFRAVTTLQINAQPAQILGSRNQPVQRFRNDDQYLQTQFGILRSRSLAARVVKNLKLADDPAFAGNQVDAHQRELTATYRLMANLEVAPQRGSDLVTLAYTDPDPARAAQISNAFASGFIETTTENRYNTTNYARTFLQDRLAAAREKLESSERALVLYAQNQGIVQLDSAGSGKSGRDGPSSANGDSLSSQTLISLNNALSDATAERIAAEQTYRQAAVAGNASEIASDPAIQSLRGERARLEAEYREKLGTFKPDYPEMQALKARIAQIEAAIDRESGSIRTTLRGKYQAAAGRENELRAKVSSLRADVLDLRNRGIGYNFLQREVDTNRELYDALLQRFKEIGVVGELGENQATVIDTALAPKAPFRPQPLRNLAIGLAIGLLAGLGLAFLIEFIDDTIKTPEDIGEMLRLPALGVVPRVAKGLTLAEALDDAKSPVSESYHSIMTALRFVAEGGMPGSILVTSSRASEGKSSTALALAQNLARTSLRVLLIDADMRNPSFVAATGESAGLSGLLSNSESLAGQVADTKVKNLSLLPAGPIPAAPAQLLATIRIRELIGEAVGAFDVVIVDAPPVLGLADAPILSSICDATLLVIEARSARRSAVQGTIRRLRAANARLVGAVLTKFQPKSGADNEHYGYGYGYGYGPEHAQEGRGMISMIGRRLKSAGPKKLDIGA